MEFERWKPYYVAVTDDLHYARERDEASAERLGELMDQREGPVASEADLDRLIQGRNAFVLANGPMLLEEIGDHPFNSTLIAADGATSKLMSRGLLPSVIVSDLDGKMDDILFANERGAVVIAHAHGDNLPLVEKYIPQLKGPIVPSVQCRPPEGTRNFGGLTDGDRAAFLADHFGARLIVLAGFGFGDPAQFPISPEKYRKFTWGGALLAALSNPRLIWFDEYLRDYWPYETEAASPPA